MSGRSHQRKEHRRCLHAYGSSDPARACSNPLRADAVPRRPRPPCRAAVHTLPAVAQAIIFLVILGVLVDPALLIGCVLALLMGGLLGVSLVIRTKVWVVQLVVGLALIFASILYALTNLHLMPGGGTATGLPMPLMVIAIAANFLFGILLNFGIGNYAPTLIMLSLMGMDPRLSFPIMAAGAALTATGARLRYISIGEVDLRILYAALVMLKAAATGRRATPAPALTHG